jgi:TPR repeat protein
VLTDGSVFDSCCAGALNNLACLYEHGSELTARDLSVAIDYYRAAAQLGCAAAQAGSSRGRGRGVAWRGVAQRSAEGF